MIGTTAAILGSAAIGIGGSILSSKATKHAADKASDTAADTAAQNNALTRDIYNQNAARLDPYSQGGMRAGNALQGLLGIGGNPVASPGAGGGSGALGGNIVNPANMPDMRAGLQSRDAWAAGALQAMGIAPGSSPVTTLQGAIQRLSPAQGRAWAGYLQGNPDPDTVYEQRQADYRTAHPAETTAAQGGQGTTGTGALSAFDQFRQSTNYTWRRDQGQKALELSRLPGGGYDSGATRKAITEYGQNFASNELAIYMDRLAQQQQIGLSGASALAGVSQNMVSNITANNNAAGSAAANAALASGTANANMWGGIAGSVGNAIGALGSGYRGG